MHNIRYINVIAIQNVILIAKVLIKKEKKKEFVIHIFDVEVTPISITTNILLFLEFLPCIYYVCL